MGGPPSPHIITHTAGVKIYSRTKPELSPEVRPNARSPCYLVLPAYSTSPHSAILCMLTLTTRASGCPLCGGCTWGVVRRGLRQRRHGGRLLGAAHASPPQPVSRPAAVDRLQILQAGCAHEIHSRVCSTRRLLSLVLNAGVVTLGHVSKCRNTRCMHIAGESFEERGAAPAIRHDQVCVISKGKDLRCDKKPQDTARRVCVCAAP